MKRSNIFLLSQALVCLVAGYLVSGISLVGKLGIRFFYKEYALFRSWWKTGLVFFGVILMVYTLLWYAQKKLSDQKAKLVILATLFAGVTGLILTYNDFQNTFTHRLLKERFHLGFYLFWLCWLATGIYFLWIRKKRSADIV